MKKKICVSAALFMVVSSAIAQTQARANPADYRPQSSDVVQIDGWPIIGKWMIAPDLMPAHWLGETYRNKAFREPINVIVVDSIAKTPQEAKVRFRAACERAGFPSRTGHSSGYWAWIGNRLQSQFPDEVGHAFSDEPFELNNNHGRFFGPYQDKKRFLFVGSLSREKVVPLAQLKHQYVSFNMARDQFADRLDEKSDFHMTGFLDLRNSMVGNSKLTTGDHDHMAVVLTAEK